MDCSDQLHGHCFRPLTFILLLELLCNTPTLIAWME